MRRAGLAVVAVVFLLVLIGCAHAAHEPVAQDERQAIYHPAPADLETLHAH